MKYIILNTYPDGTEIADENICSTIADALRASIDFGSTHGGTVRVFELSFDVVNDTFESAREVTEEIIQELKSDFLNAWHDNQFAVSQVVPALREWADEYCAMMAENGDSA